MNKRTSFLFIALLFQLTAKAQQNEQLWLEYQVTYPFANKYVLENTTSYQTVLNKNQKWRSLAISPNFEYSISPRVDLTFEVPIGYTTQKDGVNTFEFSPLVGGRYHITQNTRLDIRVLLRYQVRGFHQIEPGEWEISNRTRLRGEVYYCINGPNLFTDNLWYAFGDYEEFFVIDQQVNERFANLRRARLGIGYRLNYKHRFDLGYTLQSSRNEIDGGFSSIDNVIQLKYKMYLNPQKTQAGQPAR